jgi:hypothetical protein
MGGWGAPRGVFAYGSEPDAIMAYDDLEPSARLRPRVRDARGRVVKVLDPLRMYAMHQHRLIDEASLAQIAESIQPGARRMLRIILPLALGAVLLAPLGLLLEVILEGGSAWNDLLSTITNPVLIGAVFVPCLLGGVVVPWMAQRKTRTKRNRAALLLHKRCPHCGYDLQTLAVDPRDGATVCPECSCAWRLDEPFKAQLEGSATQQLSLPSGSPWVMTLIVGGLVVCFLAGLVFFFFRL